MYIIFFENMIVLDEKKYIILFFKFKENSPIYMN
jgi:hypothetical protein